MEKIIAHAEAIPSRRCKNVTQIRYNIKNKSNNYRRLYLSALSAMAMQVQSTHWEQKVKFDLDSFDIGIDNRCSVCISHEP